MLAGQVVSAGNLRLASLGTIERNTFTPQSSSSCSMDSSIDCVRVTGISEGYQSGERAASIIPPPPPSSALFAALTIASTRNCVMSPRLRAHQLSALTELVSPDERVRRRTE